MFLKDPRRCEQAPSVKKASLESWLKSDEGKEWRAQKLKRRQEAESGWQEAE
jgi:hypothetical protein